MSLDDAFADDVSAREFLEEHLEEIFEPHEEVFGRASDVDIVAHLRLSGHGGGDWTIVLSEFGLDVEDGWHGRALVTVLGDAEAWPYMRPPLHRLIAAADALGRRHADEDIPDERRLTSQRLNRLEDVNGWIDIAFEHVEGIERADLELVFNDDTPQGEALRVTIDMPALLEVVEDGRPLKSLLDDESVRVGGDMKLPVRLMGALA